MTDDSAPPAFAPGLARWRKSSFSGESGCVAFARLHGDQIALRDSKAPEGGTLLLTRAELAAWLAGIKAGEFDDLAGIQDPD
jgi:hypothetical protein